LILHATVVSSRFFEVTAFDGGTDVVTLDETAAAVRLLAERARVVAEGAGALAVASALSGRSGGGRIVAIVSGGNIDSSVLATILAGETP
jgi:threonine dehydratase